MGFKYSRIHSWSFLVSSLVLACTEPFDAPPIKTAGILVVDARITDENKEQLIKLSRSVSLDSALLKGEGGASIILEDNLGNTFGFTEREGGAYASIINFGAEADRTYQLKIQTSDGSNYLSQEIKAPAPSKIDRLYAEKGIKDSTEQGVYINIDNTEVGNDPYYYKYEYEETYKIIAPLWVQEEAYFSEYIPTIPSGGTIDIRPRIQEERVCYATDISRDIIQVSTQGLSNNRIEKFPVRFINKENSILTHRYSILVRQYVQSLDAFTYYETLAKLSTSENVFSQVQTGYLEGNVTNSEDSSEKVLGYFEIAVVNKQRLFFEYEDIFPGERLPDFPFLCGFLSPSDGLRSAVEFEQLEFYDFYVPSEWPADAFSKPGPYVMVPRPCGDCTALGGNVVPDFWTE